MKMKVGRYRSCITENQGMAGHPEVGKNKEKNLLNNYKGQDNPSDTLISDI